MGMGVGMGVIDNTSPEQPVQGLTLTTSCVLVGDDTRTIEGFQDYYKELGLLLQSLTRALICSEIGVGVQDHCKELSLVVF